MNRLLASYIVLVLLIWKSESFSNNHNERMSHSFTETTKKAPFLPKHQLKINSMTRMRFLGDILSSQTILGILMIHPDMAWANNLPPSNGADLSKTGTISTLIPIIRMQMSLQQAQDFILEQDDSKETITLSSNDLHYIDEICKNVPKEEKQFKKMFDEYSDPVSYKQRYMDQNAFLVYYTKGFDGIGRESIEKGDIPKQVLQYGARNEAWNAFDDFMAEVQYYMDNGGSTKVLRNDLLIPLNQSIAAFDAYFKLVPNNDLALAKERI